MPQSRPHPPGNGTARRLSSHSGWLALLAFALACGDNPSPTTPTVRASAGEQSVANLSVNADEGWSDYSYNDPDSGDSNYDDWDLRGLVGGELTEFYAARADDPEVNSRATKAPMPMVRTRT